MSDAFDGASKPVNVFSPHPDWMQDLISHRGSAIAQLQQDGKDGALKPQDPAFLEFPALDKLLTAAQPADRVAEHAAEMHRCRTRQFKGDLFLIGGHSNYTIKDLLKLAPDKPKVAVVAMASKRAEAPEEIAEMFEKAGVPKENITVIVAKGASVKTTFKTSVDVDKSTDVVYFGGGAQDKLKSEFSDHQLKQVKKLLLKGAVVAGNSAGAAVMPSEMIADGDEKKLEHQRGFGITPWAIIDTHVGQRDRQARDVHALYEIGQGKLPVVGLDEDTAVRFHWKHGKLFGEVNGPGIVRVYQKPGMPALRTNRPIMSKILDNPGKNEEAEVWELKKGDTFRLR